MLSGILVSMIAAGRYVTRQCARAQLKRQVQKLLRNNGYKLVPDDIPAISKETSAPGRQPYV